MRIFCGIFLFFVTYQMTAQRTLSGYVRDAATGETLIGATVADSATQTGSVSNEYGFFSLSLKGEKQQQIRVSYVGFTAQNISIFLKNDTLLNIALENAQLQTVEINAAEQQRNSPQMSFIKLDIAQLKKIPSLGEVDILKALSLLPGISTGAEGGANLFVRGGTPDQNLILLDGAPVYNVTHLAGYLSVFNAEAIKNVEVFKGGFPARYGGRLSSVIDVTMKEGNNQRFSGNFGIGLLTSRLLLESPILKNKTSFLVAARSSYLGLVNAFKDKNAENSLTDYWLYDVNLKINHRIDDKQSIFLSFYTGKDIGTFSTEYIETKRDYYKRQLDKEKISWGNTTLTARYSNALTPKLYLKALALFSQYDFKDQNKNIYESFVKIDTMRYNSSSQSSSSVKDLSLKLDFDYFLDNKNSIKFGIGATKHYFVPSDFSYQRTLSQQSDTSGSFQSKIATQEFHLYAEDEIRFSSFWTANIGLRGNIYNVQNTTYQNVEPRFSTCFRLPSDWNLKAAYTYNEQFLHLLSGGSFGFPSNIWVPVTAKIKPQSAHQVVVGIQKYFTDIATDFTVETYYKVLGRQIEYQSDAGKLFNGNSDWENQLAIDGKGWNYGIEFLAHKQKGRFTGIASYALSWSFRQFKDLNQGKKFPMLYDRRHNISLTGNYQISKHWDFSSTWVYNTGQAVTLPVAQVGGYLVYDGRNNAKLPSYHRLDISFNYTKKTLKGRTKNWNFSIYNFYNRRNPNFLQLQNEGYLLDNRQYVETGKRVKVISIFPFLPSVSYSYTF